MNSAPLAAATRVGRSLSVFINKYLIFPVAISSLLTAGVASRGQAVSIVANTFFTSGGNALNLVDAAGGSSNTPRTFVNSQGIGLDFPWLGGPTTFGIFSKRLISVRKTRRSCYR